MDKNLPVIQMEIEKIFMFEFKLKIKNYDFYNFSSICSVPSFQVCIVSKSLCPSLGSWIKHVNIPWHNGTKQYVPLSLAAKFLYPPCVQLSRIKQGTDQYNY